MNQENFDNESIGKVKQIWMNLLSEWSVFSGVVFSPWVLLLIAANIFLIWVKLTVPAGTNLPPMIDTTIIIVTSLASGVLGALISEKWTKANEKSVLITRGKSAIRGLGLLLRNIAGIEYRVARYAAELEKHKDASANSDVVRLSYEELKVRCLELQEETVNAIEEWRDIIPEARELKTQIGLISELKNDQSKLADEIFQLKAALDEHGQKTNTDQEQIKKLQIDLQHKELELNAVNLKLRSRESQLNDSIVGTVGSYQRFTPANSYLSHNFAGAAIARKCTKCGESYLFVENSLPQGIAVANNDLCPSCRNNLFSSTVVFSGSK